MNNIRELQELCGDGLPGARRARIRLAQELFVELGLLPVPEEVQPVAVVPGEPEHKEAEGEEKEGEEPQPPVDGEGEEKDGEDEEPQPPVDGEGEDLRPESALGAWRRVHREEGLAMLQRKGQQLTALVVDIARFDFETFLLLKAEVAKLETFHAHRRAD